MTLQSQLDQVLALAEKATPGPWGACNQDKGGCICGGVHSVSEDMGVAGTGSILEDLFCGNREEDADKIAANAVLIAQAVNFLREHGPAIRAAVGGEAVAVVEQTAPEGLYARFIGAGRIYTVTPGAKLYASPTATVDVGALRELVEKWRLYAGDNELCALEADSIGLNESAKSHDNLAKALDRCADELAALIGKEA